jgi:hypothetical protein
MSSAKKRNSKSLRWAGLGGRGGPMDEPEHIRREAAALTEIASGAAINRKTRRFAMPPP